MNATTEAAKKFKAETAGNGGHVDSFVGGFAKAFSGCLCVEPVAIMICDGNEAA